MFIQRLLYTPGTVYCNSYDTSQGRCFTYLHFIGEKAGEHIGKIICFDTYLVRGNQDYFRSLFKYWRREWQPTPVSLPGEFHGLRSPQRAIVHGLKNSQTRLSDERCNVMLFEGFFVNQRLQGQLEQFSLTYQFLLLTLWFHHILQKVEPTFLELVTAIFTQDALPG